MKKIYFKTLSICLVLIFIFNMSNVGVAKIKEDKNETIQVLFEDFFALSGEQEIIIETPLIQYKGKPYLPLREVIDNWNKELFWSHYTNTVYIQDLHPLQHNYHVKRSTFQKDQNRNHLYEHLIFDETISAQGSIVIGDTPDQVMFEKNGYSTFYPASAVKIMTALLALEYGELNEKITVSKESSKVPYDSSKAHIRPGDTLTLKQLIYGMFLPSGNDCAVAIAVHIAGSEENFVDMMNAKAKELGANDTNFVNSHGYHDPEQYTTPFDLALIAYEANKNPKYVKIMFTAIKLTQ